MYLQLLHTSIEEEFSVLVGCSGLWVEADVVELQVLLCVVHGLTQCLTYHKQ